VESLFKQRYTRQLITFSTLISALCYSVRIYILKGMIYQRLCTYIANTYLILCTFLYFSCFLFFLFLFSSRDIKLHGGSIFINQKIAAPIGNCVIVSINKYWINTIQLFHVHVTTYFLNSPLNHA